MKSKTKNSSQKKFSIEEIFEKLDKIIASMEKKDITIEDSLKYFKEGTLLIKNAKSSIEKIEKQIEMIKEY